ncbi:MAG TPA: glycosyltransferase family 4 protein [Actinomycetota bacterium]|nr:glycosyltransferase family 4 protein [Actinomycetota bacterium]
MWPDQTGGGRVGYVVKMYPRLSETFVVSEILAREACGTDIEIFSLRQPVDPYFHDSLARVRAPVTYVPRARRLDELWCAMGAAERELPELTRALPELLAADPEDAGQALELAVMIRRRGISHLHAHFATLATTVARLAWLLSGVPYSFTAHAKDIFHQQVDHSDLGRKLADAHHTVTISEYNLQHLRTAHGLAAERLQLVRNGVDLQAFPYGGPPAAGGPPVIAAVGRLVEKKGFGVLVDACRVLVDRGLPVHCRLAGGGPLEPELRAQVAALGLDGVVELTGPLPQARVRELIASATVFAAPCVVDTDGNADGLPTVLLEAMALGTPCVATDVTGLPEAVHHGRTGLLVGPHDPEGLADAIQTLLQDPGLRARLAVAARALIEASFDARRQAAALDDLLARPLPARIGG